MALKKKKKRRKIPNGAGEVHRSRIDEENGTKGFIMDERCFVASSSRVYRKRGSEGSANYACVRRENGPAKWIGINGHGRLRTYSDLVLIGSHNWAHFGKLLTYSKPKARRLWLDRAGSSVKI